MKSRLTDAISAIRLSRAVIKNIKENLFWAFFYNTIGIPLAAGLLYPAFGIRLNPMFGAAAMSMSSLFVVGNALRLRNFRARQPGQAKTDESEPENSGNGNASIKEGTAAGEAAEKDAATEKYKSMKEEKKMTKTIIIEGMMCAHCTGRVQKALEALTGVESVVMSLESRSAEVTLGKDVPEEILRAAVTEAGYEVVEVKG